MLLVEKAEVPGSNWEALSVGRSERREHAGRGTTPKGKARGSWGKPRSEFLEGLGG